MADHVTAVLVEHTPIGTTDDQLHRLAGAFLASFSSPATRQTYGNGLRDWFTFARANDLDPLQVRRTHIELWLRHLEGRQLADATRATKYSAVQSFYVWCVDEEIIPATPCHRVKAPKRILTPQPAMTESQLHRFLDTAKDLGGYPYAILAAMSLCALRISEACGTNVSDLTVVDWVARLSIVGKGNKPAVLVVPPQAMAAIQDALQGREIGPLFLNQSGNRMRRPNVANIIKKVCIEAGIPRMTPHSLRRTAIQVAFHRGVSQREIQRWVRHANGSTTERYDTRERSDAQSPGFVIQAAAA